MVIVSRKEMEELVMTTGAKLTNKMSSEEVKSKMSNDHPKMLVSTFSKTNGVTTSGLYCGASGTFYYTLGQCGWYMVWYEKDLI